MAWSLKKTEQITYINMQMYSTIKFQMAEQQLYEA